MAGTIVIGEGAVWMPAGWLYDAVLERAAGELRGAEPALAATLLDATTLRSVGYLDLRSVDAATLCSVLRAVRTVRAAIVRAGPSGMKDPAFFDGFVARVDELVAMLERDPRCVERGGGGGG